jgi:hypothetical protein
LGTLICSAANAQGARQGVARILDEGTTLGADTAAGRHRDFDVEVMRMSGPPRGVMFALYRREHGRVQQFMPFGANDTTTFATATYAWTNDSTVVIRLHDAGGKAVRGFRITGYRAPGTIERLP